MWQGNRYKTTMKQKQVNAFTDLFRKNLKLLFLLVFQYIRLYFLFKARLESRAVAPHLPKQTEASQRGQ